MASTMTAPMPEMLSRRDMEPQSGEWTIENCEAVRGAPYTDNVSKKMVVPHEDNDMARLIRAHEMMHAKLSPADDYLKWLERDIASDTGMKAVEEVRVNYFVAKAGFDVKLLSDGSEMPAGERIAKSGDWAGAVYSTIAFTGTGGLNQFLTGVRRHNKEWADVLRELSRKITKEIESADRRGQLSSTEKCTDTGLAPKGFYQVERLAQWVDSIANPAKDESDTSEDDTETTDEETDETSPSTRKVVSKKPPVSSDTIKKGKPTVPSTRGIPTWAEMSIERTPMPRRTKGGIGKKRRASNMGTNPRRISRLLTDPERRVFDSTKKGTGGVVLIDGSGSMQLSTSDIMRITEASAGCTVAVYSTFSGRTDGGRLFVVAEKGKMVDNVDDLNKGGGNGCDGLAVRWAVKEVKSGAPIVWVCDGIVTDWRDNAHDTLTLECVNLVNKHGIRMAPDVEGAVKILADLKRGAKPKQWQPRNFRQVVRKVSGGDA
jgi:hypothetical protein